MTEFSVWAPFANASVEVETGGRRQAMTRTAGDWFRVDVPAAAAGDDYAFIVDGSGPLPDPRSPWQPHGVYGPSRLVDHSAFAWTDQRWSPPAITSAIFYEMHVGTFTPGGTFDSAIERLDHLCRLGITHLQLMPVCQTPGVRNWGYDGIQLFAPHQALGGPDGLKRLIDACHQRGLAVVIDVVYNHFGSGGNVLPKFGPYFDQKVTTLWGKAVNLAGPHSDEVRRFFIDNAIMWLRDYHADGLRFDAVHAFYDPGAVHILEELALEIGALEAHLGRRLVLLAESDLNDPRIVRSLDAGGYGMAAQWSDDFHHALHAWLTDESSGYYSGFGGPGPLATALRNAYVYTGSYCPYRFRRHGRPAAGLSGHRFLGYSQNHDQIGNRCRGERLCHLVSPGRSRVAAAIVLTSPFLPLIFMGEEWAASTPFQYFTSHEDPEVAEATRQGRQREFVSFGWKPEEVPDPQDVATFERSRLNWQEVGQGEHDEMLRWYRRLIELRKSRPELTDGRLDCVATRHHTADNWLLVQRGLLIIAANLAPQGRALDVLAELADAQPAQGPRCDGLCCAVETSRLLLASDAAVKLDGRVLHLPPDSVAIIGPPAR